MNAAVCLSTIKIKENMKNMQCEAQQAYQAPELEHCCLYLKLSTKNDVGIFAFLTFDLLLGNVTPTTPPQSAVHISFTGTCHDSPTYQV